MTPEQQMIAEKLMENKKAYTNSEKKQIVAQFVSQKPNPEKNKLKFDKFSLITIRDNKDV
tara:strand:+ start:52 stop:231 length:180 start_codon:yes stop_codon:yes gene_type:complete